MGVPPMADAAPGADALRLENCPQCEYSLQGLPEEGICPECGWSYDRGAVIVRCRGWAVQFNSYVLGIVGAIAATIATLMLLTAHSKISNLAQVITMFVFVAVMSAITLIDRATSPRVGDWLLWITPAGIGVQRDFDPDSLLAQFRRLLLAIFMPVYVASGFVPMMFAGRFWYIGVTLMAVFGIGFFWLQRTVQPKPTIPAKDARPALFAWNAVEKIEITGPKRGRYRLMAWRSSWLSRRQLLVYVSLAGSDEMIAQLRQRIAQWYRNENHGN